MFLCFSKEVSISSTMCIVSRLYKKKNILRRIIHSLFSVSTIYFQFIFSSLLMKNLIPLLSFLS